MPIWKGKGPGGMEEHRKGVDHALGRWKAQLDGSTRLASGAHLVSEKTCLSWLKCFVQHWRFYVFRQQVSNVVDFLICGPRTFISKPHPQHLLKCFQVAFIFFVGQTPLWFCRMSFMLAKVKSNLPNSLATSWCASGSASANTTQKHLYISC